MKEVCSIGDGIREAVFGANDGSVSTFGILAGLVGASVSGPLIALVGIVQIFAAGMSMGLGAYISTKSQNEYYEAAERQEAREIDAHPARERDHVREALEKDGLAGETLKRATEAITHEKGHWLHFLLEERFGITDTSYPRPVSAGGIMFIAFVIAGIFSVLPFLFFEPRLALVFSAVVSLLVLFGVGAAKTRFTRRNPYVSGFENLMIGAVTGVVGFLVGHIVQTLL